MQVSVSTTIDRPRDDVHALVSDLAAHGRWTDHFLSDYRVEGDGVASFKLKGSRARSTIRTVSDTPDAVVEEGTDGKRRTRGTYALRPLGSAQTEVSFTNEILERGSPVEALMDPVVKLFLKRNNAKALARLKSILEGRPHP